MFVGCRNLFGGYRKFLEIVSTNQVRLVQQT